MDSPNQSEEKQRELRELVGQWMLSFTRPYHAMLRPSLCKVHGVRFAAIP